MRCGTGSGSVTVPRRAKKVNQLEHARRRALERHGLVLTKAMRHTIIESIRCGRAYFLGRQSRRVTGWEVEVEGKRVTVLYDSLRHSLITFLPEGAKWGWESVKEEAA